MDLRIAFTDPGRLRERCQITHLRAARPDEPQWADGAVRPDDAWEPLPSTLLAGLRPESGFDERSLVELVSLPTGRPPTAFAQLTDPLGDPQAIHLGHHTNPPGMVTTTVNRLTGRLVGVHVDNFERLDYQSKHHGRRRLCFNLGPSTRHLLLGDLDIRTVTRTLHPDHEHRHPHTDDLRAYIASGRPVRCLRVRLDPGEGYIAPTELLPHDGSTFGQSIPSTAAFWLGQWTSGVLASVA